MVRRRVAGRTRSAPKPPPPVLKDDKEKRRLLPVAPVIPPAGQPVKPPKSTKPVQPISRAKQLDLIRRSSGNSGKKLREALEDFFSVSTLDLDPLERRVVEGRERLRSLVIDKDIEANQAEAKALITFLENVAPSVASSIYEKHKERFVQEISLLETRSELEAVKDLGLEEVTDIIYYPSSASYAYNDLRSELGLDPLKSRKDIDLERLGITEKEYEALNVDYRTGAVGLSLDPVKHFIDQIEDRTLRFDGKIGQEGYKQVQGELDKYKEEFVNSLGGRELSSYDQAILDRAFSTAPGSKFYVSERKGSGFNFGKITDSLFNIVGNQLGDDFISNMLKADLQNVRKVFEDFQDSGDIFAALGDTFNAQMASPTNQFTVSLVPGGGSLLSTGMRVYTKINQGEDLTTADAFDLAVSAAQYGAYQEAQAVESQLLAEGFNTEVAAAEAAEASQRYMDKFYLDDLNKVDNLQKLIESGTDIPQAVAQIYGGDLLDAADLEGYQEIVGQIAVDTVAGASPEQTFANIIQNTEQGKNLFYENLNRAGVPMSAINLLYEDDKGARVLTDYLDGVDLSRSIASIYSEDIANSLLGEDGNVRAATIAGLKSTKNYTGVDFEDPTSVSDFLKQTYTDYTDAGGNLDFFNFLQGDGEEGEGLNVGFDFGSFLPDFEGSFLDLTGQSIGDFFANVPNPFEYLSGFELGSLEGLDIDTSLLDGDFEGLEGFDTPELPTIDLPAIPDVDIDVPPVAVDVPTLPVVDVPDLPVVEVPTLPVVNVPDLGELEGIGINTPTAPELPSFGGPSLSLDAALDGLDLPSLEGSLDLDAPSLSLDFALGGSDGLAVAGSEAEEDEENKDPNAFQGLDYDANILGDALARIKSLKV